MYTYSLFLSVIVTLHIRERVKLCIVDAMQVQHNPESVPYSSQTERACINLCRLLSISYEL